jgi:hypothetical protein
VGSNPTTGSLFLKGNNMNKKPPLGVIPRKLYMEQRALLLLRALTRRIESGYPMDITTDEWIEELKDISKNYLSFQKK